MARYSFSLQLVALLVVARNVEAQSATTRAEMARLHQAALRSEGCSSCKVWVSGDNNTVVHILDTQAQTVPNDYKGYPLFWCRGNIGFKRVIFYFAPGRVYAQHSC
jgi:hypothetical protein